jgi:hypothetical protein
MPAMFGSTFGAAPGHPFPKIAGDVMAEDCFGERD